MSDLYLNGKKILDAYKLIIENIITSKSGTNVNIVPGTGGITKIGDAGSTSHSLNSNDDLFVTRLLEVDGAAYFDNLVYLYGATILNDNVVFRGHPDRAGAFKLENTAQTVNSMTIHTGVTSNSIIISEYTDINIDFGHAQQTNPTIFLHSADGTDVTQWLSLAHNQTDVIEAVGSGNKVTHHLAPVSVDDDASFTLPDASTGFGFFMAGDNEEYAQIAWTSAGAVTLINNSANVVAADTDGNLCFIDGGTQVSVKNRLGAAKEIMFDYHYTT